MILFHCSSSNWVRNSTWIRISNGIRHSNWVRNSDLGGVRFPVQLPKGLRSNCKKTAPSGCLCFLKRLLSQRTTFLIDFSPFKIAFSIQNTISKIALYLIRLFRLSRSSRRTSRSADFVRLSRWRSHVNHTQITSNFKCLTVSDAWQSLCLSAIGTCSDSKSSFALFTEHFQWVHRIPAMRRSIITRF